MSHSNDEITWPIHRKDKEESFLGREDSHRERGCLEEKKGGLGVEDARAVSPRDSTWFPKVAGG